MKLQETGTETDRAGVVQVALDYFEGWFEGDPARMDRALHPQLAKRSLRQVDPDLADLRSVTKEQMVGWTKDGEGTNKDPGSDRQIDVEVVDLHGNIATVVVRSTVYREYLHLVRVEEGWKVVNALWHWA